MTDPLRVVGVEDLFSWLPAHDQQGAVVATLPDAAELGMSHDDWEPWYISAAVYCLRASTGPTVFSCTDRKRDGLWVSKPALLAQAAMHAGGHDLLWHKIILLRSVGATTLHRPGYTHLLAYGPGRPGKPRPDVITGGHRLSGVSIGDKAAAFVADYLAEQGAKAMLNPGCGYGTLLAAANDAGLDAYGCDIDPARVERAQLLRRQAQLWEQAV